MMVGQDMPAFPPSGSAPGRDKPHGASGRSRFADPTPTVVAGTAALTTASVVSGRTLTVNLSGVSDVQLLTVRLPGVTGTFSQILPDTTLRVKILPVDVNGDSIVNSADTLVTRSCGLRHFTGRPNCGSAAHAHQRPDASDFCPLIRARSALLIMATIFANGHWVAKASVLPLVRPNPMTALRARSRIT